MMKGHCPYTLHHSQRELCRRASLIRRRQYLADEAFSDHLVSSSSCSLPVAGTVHLVIHAYWTQ